MPKNVFGKNLLNFCKFNVKNTCKNENPRGLSKAAAYYNIKFFNDLYIIKFFNIIIVREVKV